MKNTENKKENPQSPETSESIKQGKQQIEINKNIADKEKPKEKKDKDEANDAEKWRNEG